MKTITSRWTALEVTIFVVIAVLVGIIAYINWPLALLACIVVIAGYLYNYKMIHRRRRLLIQYLDSVVKGVTQGSNFALQNLPTAMVVIDSKARICWSNSVFRDWLSCDMDKTQRLNGLIPSLRLDKLWGKSGFFQDLIGDRYFRVIYKYIDSNQMETVSADMKDNSFMALYFDDITDVERARQQAVDAMPVMGIIQMDNIEEVTKGLGDMEYTNLWAEINNSIVDEINKRNGFVRNYQEDSYIFTVSKTAFLAMKEENFPLVGKIRNIPTARRIPATISVGMAYDEPSFKEQAERVRFALELALGRGGDQVCVYENENVKFFGGRTQGSEKNTRVKARVVSQAIKELMNDADRIIVMGHQREDYDALGGAVGVYVLAQSLGKPVSIALSAYPKSIQRMVDLFKEEDGYRDTMFITAEQAEKLVTDSTLVVVTDVHRPDMVAAPKLLDKTKKCVVIDHHRRASDFIAQPLLTYLEPSVSSTSELVTELIQYFGEHIELSINEASAIYAGIILDTKNFSIQTGARTFDAASFLRRSGANVDIVRGLFTDTFDAMQVRAKMLSNAESINGLAFTVCPEYVNNPTVVSAQTADMLITVEGIEAGFVFYQLPDHVIGVSARSQGKLNVQLIMEAVGGGGHRTVAGAQLANMNVSDAKALVRKAALEALQSLKEE
ncbi:DHH family phosphoesterase [Veillonella montpellierensis]|uniref:DHH family phosphoesterase n=1 Tax=Veillonella montpellierensis TaxID=187328 RepID=UPI0023F98372|nr:DHH family phosphoesterase [Veillonella montpellierensis]